ncbi:uncharacterized protein PITG_18434 [Phytophthora infestans T30-4]|uniref:Uncharacterized protein n=1 Tax=Phytophthora infestans (strain T30-4) TaxID=403677 RepID=D0NX06_PHYIT|nr:uncharacterized protein PITG_18434 [Phytophthora infestans T30-4]EEY67598.1 conserved hypothetical protein [Phytophthora infestans T30-4]|eukprot:XP_002896363.1 conserved hypothetical protein [Phytophthora infestans T30-4]
MSSRSPRDLVAACMDHIALEGSSGLSVASLFSSVESSDDVFVRRQVWRRLRSSHGVLHFFRGSATSIQKLSKKRKRPGPTDNEDNLVEIKREMLQAAGVLAVDDTTALTTEEMALLTYEEAVAEQQEQDKQVMVAACEELRHRALNIPVKAIAADLGAEHLVILEAVGRARVQGVTVTTLTSLLSGGTVKRLHNCLDTLISNGLVVKRMMIVARPAMRRLNIIHLPRFAAEFRPQMFDESADFESDEQSRKILCAAAEKYLKGLPTHSSVLSDLGRDLSLQKRHLEVLRSHVMQECKADENFPLELFQAVLQPSRRASLEPKILNCVRYKPPNTRKTRLKVERQYTVRANKALKVALGGAEVDGTSARRREHILERLEDEKIISLSSLRDSVFSMEKQRADGETTTYTNVNCLMSPVAVGKVDTRSIFRIATELEGSRKLRLLQLPLPARNVSTKFRALRCVVAPGYEHNDVFIQGFVKNYCRDERLRRIHRNADQSEVVRFHKIEAENNEKVEHGSARKRPRTESKKGSANANETKNLISASDGVPVTNIETIRHASDIEAEVSVPALPQRNEISYKIRRFVSQQKSGIHNQQFRKLGFAYGVMYRCKILHRFLWNALHANGSNLQLPGDGNDVSIQSLNEDDRGERSASGSQATPLPGIVFSRESVLHSMPVYLYIQIFSGGGILTDAEFAVVEEAVAHQRTFDAMPETLREKIWCHESQRTSKVLGTLADLGLVQPHKIGMKHLVKILRAGYTDGRDGVLSRALKDNALGGLFRFNKQVRISLNDCGTNDDLQTGTERRGVNELDSIRIVGFTEKTYSFSNALPLQFSFESVCDVDRYWEALECLCLEQMAMEVETPRRNEPAVCEVPKPVKTRARRMLRILAWIPKSRKPVAKDKREDGADGLTAPQFKSSGIVSSNIRPRKRRRAQPGGDDIDGVKRKHRKKHPDNLDEDQSNVGALTWTDEHEQLLVEYFIDNCKSRWRITIPQGLQRENEQIAFRNHTISRTGFGLVAIARKLGKRKIDVKKRLKEKLMEPVVKLLFESAKREAELAENVGGLFDEEMAIQGSTRLTALFRRAVMMIVSPREDYHPLVAEELISFWTPHEIRLVWRYLWLKNWIVRASEKERGRGYSTSKRLQDSLKVNTLSYPLLLFQQAAEQESMVSSTLEEIAGDSNDVRQSDQLFEDDFPTNATPGQCALELGCQVLRTCSLAATHSSAFDTDKGIADALATQQTNGKRLPSSTKRESLLTCKSLKDRSGFAAHLANKVNVARASDLIDSWRVETKMHAVSVENADLLSICEAFSQVETGYKSALDEVASRPLRYRKESDEALGQAVIAHVRESGEEGLTLSFLTEKVCSKSDSEMRVGIARCLDALVDQGELICVNAYKDQRYIVKEHGDVWMLRPFSLVPSSTPLSTPHVVFEGEKDTLSFPWLKMDGGTNYKFLFSIQRKLLALILQAPGITEKRAHTNLNKLLSLQDTREAMSLLVDEGLVYARATTHPAAAQARNLFGSSLTQPSVPKVVKFAGRVLAYDRSVFEVHYFPHVQCIQRFGSIVQDYQNEVFQND